MLLVNSYIPCTNFVWRNAHAEIKENRPWKICFQNNNERTSRGEREKISRCPVKTRENPPCRKLVSIVNRKNKEKMNDPVHLQSGIDWCAKHYFIPNKII